jgi:hypothetical protein
VDDTKDVQGLALVLVDTLCTLHQPSRAHKDCVSTNLDLDIEHGISPDSQAEGVLNVVGEPLLVCLLDRSPLLPELRVLGEGQKTFKELEILEPDFLIKLEGLSDEVAEKRVALIEPSARSD